MNCWQRLLTIIVFLPVMLEASPGSTPEHGITLPGTPKYSSHFQYFDYAIPDVPKGGEFSQAIQGNFDNLNPYSINGTNVAMASLPYDQLMHFSLDEPYTAYGLVAESVERAPDHSWVIFNLRPEARFHDGKPITSADVAFSYEILISKGDPLYKVNLSGVESVEQLSKHRILFRFQGKGHRKLPFFLAGIPVLPKHYWESGERDFSKSTLDVPVGSGPYRITKIEPGHKVVYTRDPDYWGRNLPVNRGRFNFDQMRFEYVKHSIALLESLKSSLTNFMFEPSAKVWHTAYNFSAIKRGDIVRERIRVINSIGMNGFLFNTRRPPLDNRGVREALVYLYDFEWQNTHLMYEEYARVNSYFVNTELAARGLPSEAEKQLLKPFSAQLMPEVLTREYQPPKTDGTGNNRKNIAKALSLLKAEGWALHKGKMVHVKTGEQMSLTVLNQFPQIEISLNNYKRSLEQVGIQLTIRTLDTSQFVRYAQKFDYDLVNWAYGHSHSPGKELLNLFGCETRDQFSSQNRSGICDPVVDYLINKTEEANTKEELITNIRALDRVLLWGHYGIPKWYMTSGRLAYSKVLKHPDVQDLYGMDIHTWWYEPESRKSKKGFK